MKNNIFRFLVMITFILLITFTSACAKSTNEKESQLSLNVNVADKQTLSVIKFLVNDYKKDNPNIKINLNSITANNNISIDTLTMNEPDIIFASRNSMIELANKGSLDEMTKTYDKNKLDERNFSVMNSYGRYGDKFYGIGLVPYTIEFYYNINSLKSLNISAPQTYDDFIKMLAIINKNSIKIPVILTEDINFNMLLASIVADNNSISINKLDSIYNSNAQNYKKLTEMQGIFDKLNDLTKNGYIKKDYFEAGNENSLNNLKKGSIPALISISSNNMELNSSSIKLFDLYDKINMPIIMNCLICECSASKNTEEVENFIKFAESDKFQNKLISKGFITGNKKVNEDLTGNAKIISNDLMNGSNNSILFSYDLPNKFNISITKKIEDILNGKYNKNEWNDIVNSLF